MYGTIVFYEENMVFSCSLDFVFVCFVLFVFFVEIIDIASV